MFSSLTTIIGEHLENECNNNNNNNPQSSPPACGSSSPLNRDRARFLRMKNYASKYNKTTNSPDSSSSSNSNSSAESSPVATTDGVHQHKYGLDLLGLTARGHPPSADEKNNSSETTTTTTATTTARSSPRPITSTTARLPATKSTPLLHNENKVEETQFHPRPSSLPHEGRLLLQLHKLDNEIHNTSPGTSPPLSGRPATARAHLGSPSTVTPNSRLVIRPNTSRHSSSTHLQSLRSQQHQHQHYHHNDQHNVPTKQKFSNGADNSSPPNDVNQPFTKWLLDRDAKNQLKKKNEAPLRSKMPDHKHVELSPPSSGTKSPTTSVLARTKSATSVQNNRSPIRGGTGTPTSHCKKSPPDNEGMTTPRLERDELSRRGSTNIINNEHAGRFRDSPYSTGSSNSNSPSLVGLGRKSPPPAFSLYQRGNSFSSPQSGNSTQSSVEKDLNSVFGVVRDNIRSLEEKLENLDSELIDQATADLLKNFDKVKKGVDMKGRAEVDLAEDNIVSQFPKQETLKFDYGTDLDAAPTRTVTGWRTLFKTISNIEKHVDALNQDRDENAIPLALDVYRVLDNEDENSDQDVLNAFNAWAESIEHRVEQLVADNKASKGGQHEAETSNRTGHKAKRFAEVASMVIQNNRNNKRTQSKEPHSEEQHQQQSNDDEQKGMIQEQEQEQQQQQQEEEEGGQQNQQHQQQPQNARRELKKQKSLQQDQAAMRSKWMQAKNKLIPQLWLKIASRKRPKSVKWLSHFICSTYESKISADYVADRENSQRMSMPDYVFQYVTQTYGTRGIVDEYVASVLVSVELYQDNIIFAAFRKFLLEEWDINIVNIYLKAASYLQWKITNNFVITNPTLVDLFESVTPLWSDVIRETLEIVFENTPIAITSIAKNVEAFCRACTTTSYNNNNSNSNSNSNSDTNSGSSNVMDATTLTMTVRRQPRGRRSSTGSMQVMVSSANVGSLAVPSSPGSNINNSSSSSSRGNTTTTAAATSSSGLTVANILYGICEEAHRTGARAAVLSFTGPPLPTTKLS